MKLYNDCMHNEMQTVYQRVTISGNSHEKQLRDNDQNNKIDSD